MGDEILVFVLAPLLIQGLTVDVIVYCAICKNEHLVAVCYGGQSYNNLIIFTACSAFQSLPVDVIFARAVKTNI